MPKSAHLPIIAINLIMVVSLAAIWIAFAPVNIGGQATYVMVNGNSMEPGFHKDDLAIVKAAPAYNVGDIVTYHDAEMGANVIHRIIAMDQDHYVLQGDNNSWIDAYHPTRDEIIGKLWIHAPQLGVAMQWLRLPVNMALTTALLGGFLMTSILPQQKKHTKGKTKNKPSGNTGGWFEMTLYGLGLVAVVFLGLAIFAFTRPLTRTAEDIKYKQTSAFSYTAAATPGIYDTEMLGSGEPIFPKLTCSINIGLIYNLVGDNLQEVSGKMQINAYVADSQSGWQRTIPLQAETAFLGATYFSTAILDLCQVQAMLASVEQQTGFHPGTYTLTILPQVDITAQTAGQQLNDTFASPLVFNFDSVHFFLANNKPGTDPLSFSKDGVLLNTTSEANTLSALGLEFRVLDLRLTGVIGLGIAMAGLLIISVYFLDTARRSPEALIRMKYGTILMEVYKQDVESNSPVIDVTSIDDLARLAERQNAMILHTTHNFLQYYFIQSEDTTYRYVSDDGCNHRASVMDAD